MAVTRRKKRSNSSTLNNTNNNSFTKKLKDKRVSFANSLEQKPLVHNEENSVVRVEEVDNGLVMKKPKKGILKQPPSVKPMNRKSKALMKSSTNHCGQTDEKRRNKKMRNTAEEIGIKQRTNRKVRIVKIQRSTKEALMGLSKKERRDFIRKLESVNKPNYELVRKAKLMWEVIRNTKTAEDKREQFVHELLSMCTGKLARLVYSHSTCRVVQCLIALKKAKIREQIFDELKPEILRMAKSKYANYLVSKMLKYGSKNQRDIVINAFQGHCVDLYRVSHSNNVLENVYNEWATAEQRHSIVAEFYGNEFDFFKKEHNIPNSQLNISTILHNYPEKTQSIMQNLEKLLEKSVLKIPTLKLSLTHKLLLDYLTHCTDEQRKSMIELLKDQLPEICHSNEGSRAALLCVWDANVEYREAIVNSFHGLAIRSSCDEFARRVLFGIFDTVDDTNLVNEVITNEISNSIADLVYHKFGVWVLHYLVHPRDRRVIGKGLTEMLIPGDSNRYTKTVAENRYIALFECVRDNLLTFIKANMRKMLFDKTSSVLVLDTLEVPKSYDLFPREIDHNDLDDCFRAIAAIACDEFIPHSPDGPSHIVQGGCARFVFRKLLQEDPLRPAEHRLSDFLATIPAENLSSWTGMDCGCYALVEMYKSGSKKARTAIRRAISVNMLQNSQLVGAKVLLMYFQLGKEHKQKHAEIEIVYDGQSLQSSTNVRSSTSPRKKKTKKIKI